MKPRQAARLLLSAVVACFVVLCAVRPMPQSAAVAASAQPAARVTIRVGMWTLWHDRQLTLTPGTNATLRTCATCTPRPFALPIAVRADGSSVSLVANGQAERSPGAWLTGAVTLAGHHETVTMRNPLTITARAGVLVIGVTLPVESYVERVVASESGPADGLETLKALAIVVRSYALHEAHGHADYDVCDSTHCQLLHWSEGAQQKTAAEAATLATAGETLWFHGRPARAYFSKDCGGQTASPTEIWPRARPASYLPSRPDPYCGTGGGSEWAAELSRAELTSALAARGLAAPGWMQLGVARRSQSGRVVTLRLDNTDISAEKFRLAVGAALGWGKVPSTWFEVTRQGDRFLFHGRGWGHGVGLCQKGAAAMGARGNSRDEILTQYFPGAEAVDEATGQTWKRFAGHGFTLESLNAADARYLPEMEKASAEAAQRSGLNAKTQVTVRAFVSTQAFREATLEPGWVAAFARGDWIASQPLRMLAARRLLAATFRHEFLHALIEQESAPGSPLWLREGLAEAWGTDGNSNALNQDHPPALRVDALDDALAHAASEAQSQAAHRAAEWYAAHLLDRYGRTQVLEWLRSGVPGGIFAALGQR